MAIEIEHAERIAVLEVEVKGLREEVRENTRAVQELLSIVQQAKGARLVLLGLGTVAGSAGTVLTLAATKWSAALHAMFGAAPK